MVLYVAHAILKQIVFMGDENKQVKLLVLGLAIIYNTL